MSKAYLYCDWCYMRSNLRASLQSMLLVMLIVSIPVVLGSADGVRNLDATMLVNTFACMAPGILAVGGMTGLFYADEADGWQEARLCLPATRAQLVGSRFLLAAVLVPAATLAGALVGVAVTALTRLAPQAFGTWRLSSDLVVGVCLDAMVMLVVTGFQMAVYFAMGARRGRVMGLVPALMVVIALVGLASSGVALMDASSGPVMPSPLATALFVLVWLAGSVGAYLLALVVARRAFARREL